MLKINKSAMETIKKKPAKKVAHENGSSMNGHAKSERIPVNKTYKLYIDGKFPRTESGRFYSLKCSDGTSVNVCRSSRKDLRESIVSNRKAQPEWSSRSAFNKGQILYRIAETMEGRSAQFRETMVRQGYTETEAKAELNASIDLLVYYAGWTDKYIQIFSSVNPVESAHFNFSYPEPSGIATVFPAADEALLSLVASIAPVIAGGNTCTVIAAENYPLTAIDFAEVLNASDVPGGVINMLTGQRKELISHASSHMDVNMLVYNDLSAEQEVIAQTNAALNVKRVINYSKEELLSPYRILSCQDIKTTWHPVGI
jgi:acyl-CoA reductase-like NAD-dependent aldehyde dehydrogenase